MGQPSPRALEMWYADPMARQGSLIPACPGERLWPCPLAPLPWVPDTLVKNPLRPSLVLFNLRGKYSFHPPTYG